MFACLSNMPVLCIMPTTQSALTTQPIFLAYTQSGPGHYDCVLPIESSDSAKTKPKKTRCTCGRNPKNLGTACSSLRCACVREKKECTILCVCKGCSNEHGIRPPPSTTRRRQSYDNQRQPLRGKPTTDFMVDTGEPSSDGCLTVLETLVLKCILVYFIIHGFEVTTSNVMYVYRHICRVCDKCNSIEFPLFDRDIQCIERFLSKYLMHFSY